MSGPFNPLIAEFNRNYDTSLDLFKALQTSLSLQIIPVLVVVMKILNLGTMKRIRFIICPNPSSLYKNYMCKHF